MQTLPHDDALQIFAALTKAGDKIAMKSHAKTCKLMFLTKPHCPTGRLITAAHIQQLETLGKPVVIDEIYLPHYIQDKITLVRPTAKNIISLSGFSKTLGLSSIRLCWALGPTEWLTKASLIGLNLIVDLPMPSFLVGNMALKNWNRILASISKDIEPNRSTLMRFKKSLGPFLSHDLAQGHFATLKMPTNIKTVEIFISALKQKSVFLRPGNDLGLKRHFRMSLMVPPKDFKTALENIASLY